MPAFWRVGVCLLWFFSAIYWPVFAARSITITSDKSSLFGDEELTISSSCSGFTDGEQIYIKGALYQEGSSNYFGYSKNESNWIKNGETTTNQRLITIGQWDQNLNIRSDFSDSGYKGEGEYKFKLGFYYKTSGGNLSSVNWSNNNLTITLNEPDPTPTNSPTPSNTPTNSPQPTSTNTTSPTSKLTNTPTPKPTSKNTPTVTLTQSTLSSQKDQASEEGDILGAKNEDIATSSVNMDHASSNKTFIITFLFIGIGCAILSLVIVLRKQFFST